MANKPCWARAWTRLSYPRDTVPPKIGALLLRSKLMGHVTLSIFISQACALSALRQPQFCARTTWRQRGLRRARARGTPTGDRTADPLQRPESDAGRRGWSIPAFDAPAVAYLRHSSAAKEVIHGGIAQTNERIGAASLCTKPCNTRQSLFAGAARCREIHKSSQTWTPS